MQKSLAASNGKPIEPGRKRQRRFNELRPIFAAALQGRTKHLGDRHAEERRSGIRPIIDVLLELSAFPSRSAAIADEGHRIDFEQERRRAVLRARLWIEDVRLAEGKFLGLGAAWILV